jgi:hypothetical protein
MPCGSCTPVLARDLHQWVLLFFFLRGAFSARQTGHYKIKIPKHTTPTLPMAFMHQETF